MYIYYWFHSIQHLHLQFNSETEYLYITQIVPLQSLFDRFKNLQTLYRTKKKKQHSSVSNVNPHTHTHIRTKYETLKSIVTIALMLCTLTISKYVFQIIYTNYDIVPILATYTMLHIVKTKSERWVWILFCFWVFDSRHAHNSGFQTQYRHETILTPRISILNWLMPDGWVESRSRFRFARASPPLHSNLTNENTRYTLL